jgi:hypothetical protein
MLSHTCTPENSPKSTQEDAARSQRVRRDVIFDSVPHLPSEGHGVQRDVPRMW